MATKLKRAQALAAQPPIAPQAAAGGRREGGESKRNTPPSGGEPEIFSFGLADIKNARISVVAKGVVVPPPRPRRLVVELTFEIPVETPEC